ncbi:Coenzyme F420 hydrogenase/dehydrogenase, beta subunit C-terminal domain [Methanosarcina sp.]|nr:Coenzyme F420 hydrogenase/dehydrogenase, beta subunit C-terminal domain [Methanosarcina sp.]MDY9927072.1 Coenzyme F420 hydrogenase/dehydrogenase, beta subunit C-terminal domain [Methanosarcina sp.]
MHPGCGVCTDLTALKSDISVGSVGSPKFFKEKSDEKDNYPG